MDSNLSPLNMSSLPPVFILPTHMQNDDLHETEDALYQSGGRLTYRASEARIFLGKVLHKRRAIFDLRSRGLWTEEDSLPTVELVTKCRKTGYGTYTKDEELSSTSKTSKRRWSLEELSLDLPDLTDHVVVLKLEWLEDCNKNNEILPFEPYLIYTGKIIPKPISEKIPTPQKDRVTYIKAIPESQVHSSGLSSSQHRSYPDTSPNSDHTRTEAVGVLASSQHGPFHRRKFGQKSLSPTLTHSSRPPKLYRATTTEMEHSDAENLPPVPFWIHENHPRPMYSCLRSTPPLDENPNRDFIAQLNKIKEARLLTLDEIGVRAYSTSIASISAYQHRITSPIEITRLPGCNEKIASLWIEWHESTTLSECSDPPPSCLSTSDRDALLDPRRTIPIVREIESDTDLSHLRTFHNIWGVGPESARKFYFTNNWTDLDDVVEYGWTSLTRAQQIGVKFYDEFQLTIPRPEVESIARTILHHARLCKSIPKAHWTNDVVPDSTDGSTTPYLGDPRDFVAVIVGGYRRGKSQSGDVDVILSHRDERLTQDLVVDIVQSLEADSYITHTLTLHTATSDRDQQTLPYRSAGGGHGFDSLDKALCVWQDPDFDGSQHEKNPNVHRRVDIIVSSWRTVGCAVLGWSGGTTFQRDIRRWVKREKGWKFDSSGVRDRGNGLVLELEGPREGDKSDGWLDRERRLMQNIGIGWREARQRCTG